MVTGLKENVHPLDLIYRLAEDHSIVLLNGGGFDAPNWSVRVSFANLQNDLGRVAPWGGAMSIASARTKK